MTGIDILQNYKEQNRVERNFWFLKEPLIVYDLFLKKPISDSSSWFNYDFIFDDSEFD